MATAGHASDGPWTVPGGSPIGGRSLTRADIAGGGRDPLIDPDCAAGKHDSCVGGLCECPHHAVASAVSRLKALTEEHDPLTASVMLLTGLSYEQIQSVGGVSA